MGYKFYVCMCVYVCNWRSSIDVLFLGRKGKRLHWGSHYHSTGVPMRGRWADWGRLKCIFIYIDIRETTSTVMSRLVGCCRTRLPEQLCVLSGDTFTHPLQPLDRNIEWSVTCLAEESTNNVGVQSGRVRLHGRCAEIPKVDNSPFLFRPSAGLIKLFGFYYVLVAI